jgi:hypothetical protein
MFLERNSYFKSLYVMNFLCIPNLQKIKIGLSLKYKKQTFCFQPYAYTLYKYEKKSG